MMMRGMAYPKVFLGIGYDWSRAQAPTKTHDNAVGCAASLDVAIVILFRRMLRVFRHRSRKAGLANEPCGSDRAAFLHRQAFLRTGVHWTI